MSVAHAKAGAWLGILGIALTLAFWVFIALPVSSARGPTSPYVLVLLPTDVVLALVAIVAAARMASKWWLLALIGPVTQIMGLLSVRFFGLF
jgi:hypothetical protein